MTSMVISKLAGVTLGLCIGLGTLLTVGAPKVVAQSGCRDIGSGACGGYNHDTKQNCLKTQRPINQDCNGKSRIVCRADSFCR
jgi:hypothetical protein